jgi:hypothetical protein
MGVSRLKEAQMKNKALRGAVLLSLFLMASGLRAQTPPAVDPLNWRELVPFLIEIPGYEAEKAEGSTTNMAGLKMSLASREYTKDENTLRIEITDGSYIPMAYAAFQALQAFEVDTSEELIRKTTIQGFPAVENIRFEDKHASLMILIADRFLVNIEGEGFKDTAELKDVAGKLDLKKLEALAK